MSKCKQDSSHDSMRRAGFGSVETRYAFISLFGDDQSNQLAQRLQASHLQHD